MSQLDDNYFRQYLNRTILLIGEKAVQTLRGKTVSVAGMGGQGGAACLTLARMGVGNFILADPKPFDEPDINRQWAAGKSTLGRNKADVYAEMLLEINPEIRIRKFCDGITTENVSAFLTGSDLLVDCLDISVPAALRAQVFSEAQHLGIYSFTGAMLGFGGMIAGASPTGVSLEVLGSIEDNAISASTIPPGLREYFVPDHMDRLEETLHLHRAPSIAVSPSILGMILSVESFLALVGDTIAGWRPPICLPDLIVVDLLRMTLRIIPMAELSQKRGEQISPVSIVKDLADPHEIRRQALADSGYNTNLIPHDSVHLDLLTDSWSEIPGVPPVVPDSELMAASTSIEANLAEFYGYRHTAPVFRGRYAEAILCQALDRKGVVLSNGLFPTTRFHLERNGFSIVELAQETSYANANLPFKGDIDVPKARQFLESSKGVAAVYLELCVNSLGGHPVSIGNLTAVRELALEHDIPIVLDGSRAFENAVLIRQREPGFATRTLISIVREISALSDACALSLTKDFCCQTGGFIGANDEALFHKVTDLLLATGDGLDESARGNIAMAMRVSPESQLGSAGRVAQVRRLWELLAHAGVPVMSPPGGHALFIDAAALLPHIPAGEFPAQALANELFLRAGIRAAVNFASPEQSKRKVQLVRVAVPVGYRDDAAFSSLVSELKLIVTNPAVVAGLNEVRHPSGLTGDFAAEYQPVT